MRKKKCSQFGEDERLMDEILQSKIALDTAYSNFQNVTEPDLIDCYIYEVKAAQTRYKYLLEQAKLNNVTCPLDSPYTQWR